MPSGDRIGGAWYELSADDSKLRAAIERSERELRQAGQTAERQFGQSIQRSADRAGDAITRMANSVSGIRDQNAEELARSLSRAQEEAEQALGSLRRLERTDLPEEEAQHYADAIADIETEARITAAELRDLQRADPDFDTAELRDAANQLDRLGDEADDVGTEFREIARTNADATLRKAAREADHAADEFKETERAAGGLTGVLNRLRESGPFRGGLVAGLGLTAGVAAFRALGNAVGDFTSYVGDAISDASDLNETISKTGVILGRESLPALEEWADGAAVAFGQSKRQALDAAATFAIFGKSAGLAGDDLAGFSTNLTELASDMASFFNASPEEAITAIGAALRGESEPIRRFGVLLDDATLRAKAFELGIISTTKNALTPSQRVLAAYAAIVEQTSDAQGDFARTSDGLANTQRVLEAQLEDVSSQIGEELLPVMLQLAQFARDQLVPALRGVVDGFGDASEGVGGFVNDLGDALINLELLFGEHGNVIEEWAAKTEGDQNDAKRIVAQGMQELNLTFEEAFARMKQILTDPEGFRDATYQNWRAVELEFMAGEGPVRDAAESLADTIPEEVADAGAQAAEEARKIPGSLAQAILSGASELDPIAELIENILAGSVSDAATLAENAATLVNPGIAQGLTSNSTETRQAMLHQVVEPLIESMNNLEEDALLTGEGIPAELQAGVLAQRDLAIAEVRQLRDDMAPEMDLAEFAEKHGLDAIAALIRGMEAQEEEAARVAGIVAGRAINELAPDELPQRYGRETIEEYGRGIHERRWEAINEARVARQETVAEFEARQDAKNAGTNTGSGYAEGLGDTVGQTEWQAAQHAARVRREMAFSMYDSGYGVGSTYASGLRDSAALIYPAATTVANAASKQIRIESEPPDPNSPLRGITTWGGNIVKTLVEGMLAQLQTATLASQRVAAELVPSFGIATPTLGMAAPAFVPQQLQTAALTAATAVSAPAAGGAPTTTIYNNEWHLHVDRERKVVRSEEEALRELREFGLFTEGRLSG